SSRRGSTSSAARGSRAPWQRLSLPAVASASIARRASERIMMTYERCVQLGRWALLLALLPALAIVAMLAWPGESAGIAICVSAGAPPIAFVLALLAVTRWRRQFRGQP